jgi:calcium-dependent protein kinase
MLSEEKTRLTPKDVLNHPWMRKYKEKSSDIQMGSKHLERLKSFEKSSKLKKAALSYLASRVDDKDIENEIALFRSLDKNKDGYLTLKELKEGMKNNPNIDEIARLLNNIDLD